MNENPLVTVYIPTYNRLELLKRAVKSVLEQDYHNIELIVVDDGSSDGTVEYLESLSGTDQRVRYFVNDVNSGACVSRNKAIWAAKGEFITGLDDDDYFYTDHISIFLSTWSQSSSNKKLNIVALYANQFVKENKNRIKKTYPKISLCSSKNLLCANWIGNQIFTKTEWLKNTEGFDKDFKAWQDFEYWYRLLIHYDGVAISTNKYTYVTDISHPHERISTRKLECIDHARRLFIEKYELKRRESDILSIGLVDYGFSDEFAIKKIFSKIFYFPSKVNIRHALVLTIKALRSRFN